MRPVRVAVFCLYLLAGCSAIAQLTDAEKKGIEDSLSVGNFRLEDLKFDRRPFKDPYRMKSVDLCIDDPLYGADFLMAWHSSASSGPASSLLATAIRNGFGDPPLPRGMTPAPAQGGLEKLPEGMRPIVATLVAQMLLCDSEIHQATSKLSAQEQREIIEGLPVWAAEEPKVVFDFVKGKPVDQKRLLELLSAVDLARIRSAALTLSRAVESAVASLKAGKFDVSELTRLNVGGMPVVIGGRENDLHSETDARLTIDLGGDDDYTGRHGAGVGYSSVLIDLGGNDHYEVKDLSVGAAILGVGIAYDGGGNDYFRGKSLCFGCGLAGVGIFMKDGGDDAYEATALAEGFGEFGIGLCLDTGGDDHYDLKLWGQGAARTQGVGWLVDRKGNDVYKAGGLSMNEPLFTGVSYSFAQGCASGYREDTGGISGGFGLITDFDGWDSYLGETYMQAASYWISIGSLYDAAGNDTYTGYHYCQASAMHLCGAYLFDLAGDDAYVTKYGASLSIGHDYGVSFFLDRAGDDLYIARDSSPGTGNANGLGIFVDSGGTDRYDGPPGIGNPARSTGSLGVFVDLGGPDKYRTGLADGQATSSTTWGTAYDMETTPSVDTGAGQAPMQTHPKPGSKPMLSEPEMEAVYKKATQWGVGSAQQEVADNTDVLIAIGVPALDWMLDKHLATADRLQQRAFAALVSAFGTDGSAALARKSFKATIDEKRNLISIALDANATDFGSLLGPMLESPDLRMAAAKAAGALKAAACVPQLTKLCLSDDRLLVRAAIVSLALIKDPTTFGTAQTLLRSNDLPTREAALDVVEAFPEQASALAATMISDTDEFTARLGMQIFGKLGTEDGIRQVGALLLDPRPGVRIEALRQLDKRCPPQYKEVFEGLVKDPVPLVRAVAHTVKP